MFYILKVPKVKGNSYITMSHQEYGFIVVYQFNIAAISDLIVCTLCVLTQCHLLL